MALQIKWLKLDKEAVIPEKAHPTDAGMDMRVLVSNQDSKKVTTKGNLPIQMTTVWDADTGVPSDAVNLLPHQTLIFHTGLACAVPEGYYLEVNPRSSLGFKQDIMLANTTGVIDCHYRGELMVALHNNSNEYRTICDGDRVVQCMLKKVEDVENVEVEELDETDRGTGGFGSSGSR